MKNNMSSAVSVKKTRAPITMPAIVPPETAPLPLLLLCPAAVSLVLLPVGAASSGITVMVVPEITVVILVVAVAAIDADADLIVSVGADGATGEADPKEPGGGVALGGGPVAPWPFSSIMLIGAESTVCVPWIRRKL